LILQNRNGGAPVGGASALPFCKINVRSCCAVGGRPHLAFDLWIHHASHRVAR
jgi:hypothetical protein